MRRAFTLIELLVVIVIIGIIAALTTVALGSVRAKARDTKRIADIRNLQSTLEIYKNDNGVYPPFATSGTALVANGQTYMAKIPTAPTNTGSDVYTYTSATPYSSYSIAYNLEKGVQDIGAGGLLALPGQIAYSVPPAAPAAPWTCGNPIALTYNSTSINYDTIPGEGNTCWLDQNLGATHVAASSTDPDAYGDLFQWGRRADGHQIRSPLSGSTHAQSSSDTPGNTFINGYSNWQSPANINLWQGVSGTNNPCPDGWQVPTEAQWTAQGITYANAFSKLKLTVAGSRGYSNGSLNPVGSDGGYWSSSVSGSNSSYLAFGSGYAGIYSTNRAYGMTVRCIKNL